MELTTIGKLAKRARRWIWFTPSLMALGTYNPTLAVLPKPGGNEVLVRLLRLAEATDHIDSSVNILRGARLGLEGKRTTAPRAWDQCYPGFQQREKTVAHEALLLGLVFGHEPSVSDALTQISDSGQPAEWRSKLIASVARTRDERLPVLLPPLLQDDVMRTAAIRGLAAYRVANVAAMVLEPLPEWPRSDRLEAFQLLASRPEYAIELCRHIERGRIERGDVPQAVVRQLRALRDKQLPSKITEIWGSFRSTPGDRLQLISRYKNLLVAERLAAADLYGGAKTCQRICLNCHRLHGDGKSIGPDLTGSQRYDLHYLLHNIIDPSAEIGPDYRVTIIETEDGRVMTGVVVSETDAVVGLQTATEKVLVDKSQIRQRHLSEESMMPNGLLDEFSDEQVRDLVAFLMSDRQVGPSRDDP